jgi:hypothetical protein
MLACHTHTNLAESGREYGIPPRALEPSASAPHDHADGINSAWHKQITENFPQ